MRSWFARFIAALLRGTENCRSCGVSIDYPETLCSSCASRWAKHFDAVDIAA